MKEGQLVIQITPWARLKELCQADTVGGDNVECSVHWYDHIAIVSLAYVYVMQWALFVITMASQLSIVQAFMIYAFDNMYA